ncbi:YihY/virulence factor BrkB family protein [Halobacillus sp. A5]|uniref:YihY/virulence factor BrkB family protein n=1 Tax=Halobacillus sp. A5 TaxID=2880263 RepID=UPI0020A6923C|nr:YihY/virulence factor BrkB family protein [Halobacillus sp. A5]MCP3027243.1 YihY/virulence factor BrkB family protein [Halobacillus sp. A5]
MKKIINYGKEVFSEFQKDNVPLLGAAQAYYYLLAIFPLVILLLSLLPYLNISAEEAMSFVQNVVPGEATDIFQENIVELVEQPNGGLLTIGILGTLWSASSGVNAFIQASNIAYNVEETRSFIKVRLLSILLTVGMIVAIAVALALPIFGDVIITMLRDLLNLPEQTVILFQILRWVVSIVVMAGTLMALYRFAPDKTLPFKEILPGALITAVLWQLFSLLFSFYVSNFANYSATYGSLGGIIILMLWFFATGMILMIGAEINVVRHRRKKRRAQEVA